MKRVLMVAAAALTLLFVLGLAWGPQLQGAPADGAGQGGLQGAMPAEADSSARGDAVLACDDCDGTGWRKCGWCGGDGIKGGKQCTFCNGRGKIKCLKCNSAGK